MNQPQLMTLRRLADAANAMGSGLSAMDRGYGSSYFNEAQSKAQRLLRSLPSALQRKFPNASIGALSWSEYEDRARQLILYYRDRPYEREDSSERSRKRSRKRKRNSGSAVVNINTAKVDDLASLKGISQVLAARIIRERKTPLCVG